MSPNLALFILVVLLVVGWFAAGTQVNVRKGHAALRWLQEGLPLLGEKTTLRWLGSSVVELKINQAKTPFREAEVLFVLEPRDVPPLWALARLRGRRDLFLFRGTLRGHQGTELEVFDPRSWSAQGIDHRCKERGWSPLPLAEPLRAYTSGQPASVEEILKLAELAGCPLVRLSLHRKEPELEVHWQLGHLRKHPSPAVLETLRRIAGGL